jgi:hypothetical protein
VGRRIVFEVNGCDVSGKRFFDLLDAAGVDYRLADYLARRGASEWDVCRELVKACADRGLCFEVYTLLGDRGRKRLL